jgi:hypothetical protein
VTPYLNYDIISLSIETLLALGSLSLCWYNFAKKNLNDEIPYQIAYLLLGLLLCFIRVSGLLISEINFQYHKSLGMESSCLFLDINWRGSLLLLSFYETAYFIMYFNRFRFSRAVKERDKVFAIVIQTILFVVPAIYVVCVYLGDNSPHTYDLSALYEKNKTILSLMHTVPELPFADSLIKNIYGTFFILAMIPVRKVWNKQIEVKFAYIAFASSVFFKIGSSYPVSTVLFNTLSRYLLNASLCIFFIFLFFIVKVADDVKSTSK